jgi:hypothetical protein
VLADKQISPEPPSVSEEVSTVEAIIDDRTEEKAAQDKMRKKRRAFKPSS